MKKIFLLAVGLSLLSMGCGKVSKSPIAPIVNPTTVYNSFDGSLNGWARRTAKYTGTFYDFATTPSALSSIDVLSLGTEHTYGDSSGAAKINVSLVNAGDSFDTGYLYSATTDVGFSGRVLSAWVYWDSGLTNSSGKVIAKFYGKFTDSWTYANGSDTTLAQGNWVQVTWAPDSSAVDITKVLEWGIEIYGATGPFSPGVVYIDNLAY